MRFPTSLMLLSHCPNVTYVDDSVIPIIADDAACLMELMPRCVTIIDEVFASFALRLNLFRRPLA